MSQRVFQVAKDLHIDSKIIVQKLMHENLPPPASDPGETGWQRPWTPRSPVSVGLREMIREWHATGELFEVVVETGEPAPAKPRKGSGAKNADMGAVDRERPARRKSLDMAGRDVTRQALEAVAQIEREAKQRKQAQLEGLRESRKGILRQIKDLERQIQEIDKALQTMAIRPAGRPLGQYTRVRRNLNELRERMAAWLESRRGEKFGAGILAREFPELGNTALSYVLRPLVEAGRIQTDASAGSKRLTYFAP